MSGSVLEARLARLEAESAVRSTFNEYLYNIDFGHRDAMMDAFAQDATWSLVNFPPGTGERRDRVGRDQILEGYDSLPGAKENRAFDEESLRLRGMGHVVTNIAVNVAADCSSAELSAYLMFNPGEVGIGGGMYQAVFRPEPDKWRIADFRILIGWAWRSKDGELISEGIDIENFKRQGQPPVYEPFSLVQEA